MYPIRILHIVGSMHPGGMENFIMNLYEHIDRSRIQFDVVVHMRRKDDYVEKIRQMGGRVYELPRLTRHPVRNLREIQRIVKENGYPIVIRHTSNALIAPQLWAAKKAGAKAICHSHNETDPKKGLHMLGRAMMRHMRIERFACSERAGKWMFGKKDFRVIHNAVDVDKYAFDEQKREAVRKEFALGNRHLYGHVANFIESKNHTYLMKIYAEIARIDPDAAFVCIGDGELRGDIEREARTLGIGEKVIFTGVRFDVDAWMSAMDVMVFPSVFEGLPLTLIEAQAAGLPCLVSEAVTKDVTVTEGLLKWRSIAENPAKWAKEAVAMTGGADPETPWKGTIGITDEDRAEKRACQRESIARYGYDIQALVKWYEDYFDRKRQLVFVTLSLAKGGAERVICNMCNEYFALKYRVSIISLMKVEPEYRLDPAIRLFTIDEKTKQYRQNMALRFVRRRKKLKKILREIKKEDVYAVISFLPEPNMLVCSLRRSLRIPAVISVRNAPTVEYRSKVRYALMRLLYPKADGYVFQTKSAKEYFSFSNHILKRSKVISNPLSAEFLHAGKVKSGHAGEVKGEFRILAVGRLESQKNYPRMLQAIRRLRLKEPCVRLYICGEGEDRGKIEKLIAEYGIEQNVCLMGRVDDMITQYAKADAFLMTSDYEGMPNALMEAMAMELPCVSTDCPCGGPSALIRNGESGMLVSMEDGEERMLEELSGALLRLIREPEFAEKLGKEAGRIREKLLPERIYRQWETLIRQTAEIERE